MKLFLLSIVFFNILQIETLSAQAHHPKELLYVGSFSKTTEGLFVYEFDRKTGTLTKLQTVAEGRDPSFVAINPDKKSLYVVYESETRGNSGIVMSFRIDPSTGLLTKMNEQPSEGRGPAHVSVDPKRRFVYVSNYGGGTLAVYPINKDGSLQKASDVIKDEGSGPHPNQKTPHVHSVIPSPDGKYVYVCDLGIDKVFTYKVDNSGKLIPGKTPFYKCTPGSGPRQFALSPNGRFAYLVEELISNLVSFSRDALTGKISQLQKFEMLPADYKERGSDATVYVSPDNKFVYASNWGPKGIKIFSIKQQSGSLTPVDSVELHGTQPRDFCIDKKGEFVFVANMGSGNLVVFKRDIKTGKLSFTGNEYPVPGIACISQLIL